MSDLIRVGCVSKINYEEGTIEVTYPDRDDAVTDPFPVLSFNDEYKMPDIGQDVLVLHLSNGSAHTLQIPLDKEGEKNLKICYEYLRNVIESIS